MIPKIVHYIWIGDKSKKPIETIDGWKQILIGWEIREWNESNLDIDRYRFARLAYDFGKYGMVIDPFRAEILWEHGGVWLDTDVILYKDLTPFLSYSFFSGYENLMELSNGVIGVTPHHPVFERAIKWYQGNWKDCKNEILTSKQIETLYVQFVRDPITTGLARLYGIVLDGQSRTYGTGDGTIRLEAPPVFTYRGDYGVTNFAKHYFSRSWMEINTKSSTYEARVKQYESIRRMNDDRRLQQISS
jgi:Glycosyltransferase sugar-binding region containing DXD motif